MIDHIIDDAADMLQPVMADGRSVFVREIGAVEEFPEDVKLRLCVSRIADPHRLARAKTCKMRKLCFIGHLRTIECVHDAQGGRMIAIPDALADPVIEVLGLLDKAEPHEGVNSE